MKCHYNFIRKSIKLLLLSWTFLIHRIFHLKIFRFSKLFPCAAQFCLAYSWSMYLMVVQAALSHVLGQQVKFAPNNPLRRNGERQGKEIDRFTSLCLVSPCTKLCHTWSQTFSKILMAFLRRNQLKACKSIPLSMTICQFANS